MHKYSQLLLLNFDGKHFRIYSSPINVFKNVAVGAGSVRELVGTGSISR